jgi:HD superfamily phosphohydrolase
MILLKRLKAGLKEQVAGLLHDVSHTAFSHTIDWVLGDPSKADFQDKNHSEFIRNSNLPKILKKHGFGYEEISDLEKFSLLERKHPGLCADRVDYTLREMVLMRKEEDSDFILQSLLNHNGEIVLTSEKAARLFELYYRRFNKFNWNSPRSRARYEILSGILKKALSCKIISMNDLMENDRHVIEIIKDKGDISMTEGLEALKKSRPIERIPDREMKPRKVDPKIILNGTIKSLSQI